MFNLRSLGSHFDTSSLALPPHFPFLMGRNTSLEPTACVSCRSTKSSEAPVQRKSSQLSTADTSNERNIPRNLLLPAPKSMWSLKRSTFVIITLCALELMWLMFLGGFAEKWLAVDLFFIWAHDLINFFSRSFSLSSEKEEQVKLHNQKTAQTIFKEPFVFQGVGLLRLVRIFVLRRQL